jgi:hypothetical protein
MKASRKIDREIWQAPDVERRIRMAAAIRSRLGMFTAACSVGIMLTSVRWHELSAVVIKWFLWMSVQ